MTAKGIEFYGGYPVYSETGVDLTMLRENMRRSVEQRWEDNRRAALLAGAFRQAGRRARNEEASVAGELCVNSLDLIRQLTTHQAEFVIVGGMAMIARGATFTTQDLEVCYRRSAANVSALVAALSPLRPCLRGAPLGMLFCFDAATLQAGMNFTLVTDLGDLDLLEEVSGVGKYEQVLAQSDEMELFGLRIRVLSLDGLIAAKKAAGRAKDQGHLLELAELKKLRDAEKPEGNG
jgi:hypothetical protein